MNTFFLPANKIWTHNHVHRKIWRNEFNAYTDNVEHLITNHSLNYFKIIILKVNKLTIHGGLWVNVCVNFFTQSECVTLFLLNLYVSTKMEQIILNCHIKHGWTKIFRKTAFIYISRLTKSFCWLKIKKI